MNRDRKNGDIGSGKIYSISPDVPFVDTLAAGVRASAGGDPTALAAVTVLLPTRRACRALTDAFLRESGGRPLLLPRMIPLGDVDEDELAIGGPAEDGPSTDLAVPPAISDLRRQLLLSRLVLAVRKDEASPDQAARLAAELARLVDQVHTERLEFRRLPDLVPEEFARHWQITLRFLAILTESWPKILAEEGCIDSADRRNRLLEAQARAWRQAPPPTPVIAAGSTGSVPATADLLNVVAGLPRGVLILPGVDLEADDETWAALEPSHPQFGMAQLLERLGVDRRTVKPWPATGGADTHPGRTALINRALRPAATADVGRRDTPPPTDALADITRIDAPGPEEEARVIALIMRETLEHADRTAALVTPDRALARRVTCELERWGVAVDDSAGRPLAETMPGAFLRLTARMAVENLAPVPFLAALKHPLAACGVAPSTFRGQVRRLERAALRGLRPAPGVAGLEAALADDATGLKPLLASLAAAMHPLQAVLDREMSALRDLLRAHVAVAEALATTDQQPGAHRLWGGDAGEAAAAFVAELGEAGDDFEPIAVAAYPALLDVLMAGRAVRPRYGRNPRLAVWGPLEARLQRADVMILGSLNEDTWPPKAQASPWMSRPMMKAFGLPLPERKIGLSAHDFTQAFAAPRIWLTRASRSEGTPTVPCRWLLRLENLLRGTYAEKALTADAGRWLHWQRQLDEPSAFVPVDPPTPRPPVEARPRRLSATQVETWMRDPYAIYARHVLRLKALKPIDDDPGAADYGSLIHKALEIFVRENPGPVPSDALDRLLAAGRRAFGNMLDRPGIRVFWWPRFERIARWFVDVERERRAGLRVTASEVKGSLILDAPAGPFELTAVADRIDTLADGTLAVIDYKTGAPPLKREVAAGFAPQLPLEAAIAEAAGFAGVPRAPVSALEYWRLRGSDPAGERISAADDPATLTQEAIEGLTNLIARFDFRETAYESRPRPAVAPRFSDYEHLARVKEWSAGGKGEE
jgi:ATP-dependent helicase/nuclease subunit B